MPVSLINSYVTPESTKRPVVHEDLARLVDQMVFGQVMFFTTVQERTATLATLVTLGLGAPPAGAISYISTLARHDRYDGANWVALLEGAANPWVVWTPTLVNLTQGNGVVTARHRTVGKTIDWRFKFVLGSTSAVGTLPSFTLPATPHSSYVGAEDVLGRGTLLDSGMTNYASVARRTGTGTTVEIYREVDTGHATITATSPFTWATGDVLSVAGTTELA